MSYLTDLRLINADLEAMPDDGNRYELIDGELYVSGAPSYIHQTILATIVIAFGIYLREHPIGRITPGVGVIFDDYDGVIPDLVFATHERRKETLVGGASGQRPKSSLRSCRRAVPMSAGTVMSNAACMPRGE